MKKIISLLKSKKGFTLIEVMVVLVIISILLLVFIPNLTKNHSVANEKSCSATLELVEAQIMAYQVETGKLPTTISQLQSEGYVDSETCPNGEAITISGLKASSVGQ